MTSSGFTCIQPLSTFVGPVADVGNDRGRGSLLSEKNIKYFYEALTSNELLVIILKHTKLVIEHKNLSGLFSQIKSHIKNVLEHIFF